MRIFRQELIEVLTKACRERGVKIEHSMKFTRVVDESDGAVEIEFGGGEKRKAGLLVGADGIHSRVRSSYVAPEVKPGFVGLAALTFAVPTAQLRIPKEKGYELPVSVASGNDVFVLAPQRPDRGGMLAGMQVPFDEAQAGRRDALLADNKESLKARLRRNAEAWPGVVRSALESISDETMNVWPFYMLPALERWASPKGRVLVLGDAAHAIPPTTGQGASMALEDAASLALILKRVGESEGGIGWDEVISREKLRDLVVLTKQLNNKRLPREEVWFGQR